MEVQDRKDILDNIVHCLKAGTRLFPVKKKNSSLASGEAEI